MMDRKRIVLLHYHLKKGGVTYVIREQVEALKDDHDLLVISGEAPEEYIHDNVSVIPELAYDAGPARTADAAATAQKVLDAVRKYFGSDCDVLHFHNPILAKNHDLLKIIKLIAGRGLVVFLQIHDFAEDGRLGSYFSEEYPADVHYGVINSRDYRYLLKAGLSERGVHLLPNCVRALPAPAARFARRHLVLYPVRAIRRKNLGEALLSSLFLREGDYIGVTLPALNRNDWRSYEDWKLTAREEGLPAAFDLGTKSDFGRLVAEAGCFLTTSVAEGFGFAFLEPWLCGRPLRGRLIPGICDDFTDNGVDLSGLYRALLVPTALVDRGCFLDKLAFELKRLEKHYPGLIDSGGIEAAFKELLRSEYIDFGLLSEKMQAEVIRSAKRDPLVRKMITEANRGLRRTRRGLGRSMMIEKNRRAVVRHYSREAYRLRLNQVYDAVLAGPVRQKIDKRKLLSLFLQPEHFSMLKWGVYDR